MELVDCLKQGHQHLGHSLFKRVVVSVESSTGSMVIMDISARIIVLHVLQPSPHKEGHNQVNEYLVCVQMNK